MTKRIFLIGAGVLCLALAVFIIVLIFSGGDDDGEPRMDELKLRMTAALAARAVADMRGKLPPEFDGAVLLHFQGHRHSQDVQRIVKKEIELTQSLRLRDFTEFKAQMEEQKKSTLSRWLDGLKSKFGDVAGEEAYERVFGKDMPNEELKEVGIDGLVGGEVVIAEGVHAEDKESIRLTLWVRKSLDGKEIFRASYLEEVEKSLFNIVYFRHVMDDLGSGWKVVIWLSFTIIVPLVTFFVPAKLLVMESNKVNMAMLAGYTILDILVVLALMGFQLSGISFVFLLIAAALSGVYNYGILTEIQDYA